MPPDKTNPIVPQGPQGENNPPIKPGVDPKSFLLPKKEVHAPENATRINAGALLESEQSAELPKPAAPTPVAPPPAPKDESVVKAVETYQGDIERVVQKGKTSVVSIAAAEAERRNIDAIQKKPAFKKETLSLMRKIVFIVGGVVFLLGAVVVIYVAFKRPPSVDIQSPIQAPFINVDETKILTIPTGAINHATMINALEAQREGVSLSLGLISRFYIATATSSGAQPELVTTTRLLQAMSSTVPGALLRAIDDQEYLLGVHSYDDNQPFLILKVDDYEQAFSGMLEWEATMERGLTPFFTRTPQLHLSNAVSTSTATSTATTTPPVPVLHSSFVDRIVENYDARVIENDQKDILLLWAFLNRSTLVITTNDATLREIISRLRSAPIVPLP